MIKSFYITIFLIITTLTYGQVGVNTENPRQIFHIDGQNDNPSTGSIDTENQANDFVVTEEGKVGIGNIKPSVSLDVNGKVRVATLDPFDSVHSIPLAWNTSTQRIMQGNSETEKPFYSLTYKIKTAENQDWVSDFDTKIPSSKYTVIITSATFKKNDDTTYYIFSYFPKQVAGDQVTNIFNFGATISNNTWRLSADYMSASPRPLANNYYWEISVIAINNSYINTLPLVNGSVNKDGEGQTTASPLP